MADTNHPFYDTLINLKAELDTQVSTWELAQVYSYPAYVQPTVEGNSICLEILPESNMSIEQVSGGGLHCDFNVGVRISFLSNDISAEGQYHECLQMLDAILLYLMANPQPNSYGTLAAVDSMDVGEIPLESDNKKLFIGSVDVTLKVTKAVTFS